MNLSEVASGGTKILFSNRLICFNNNDIEIDYQFDAELTLRILFIFQYEKEGKPHYDMSVDGAKYTFILHNFTNVLGTGLKSPIELGKYKQKSVYISFFVYKHDDSNPIIDFSLYMEG